MSLHGVESSNGYLEATDTDGYAISKAITQETGTNISESIPIGATKATPYMTDAVTPSGEVLANSGSSGTPYTLFGVNDGSWDSEAAPAWIRYDFDISKTLVKYSLKSDGWDNKYGLVDWTFEGSNDGSSWAVLDTQVGHSWNEYETKEFILSGPATYSKFRLNISAVQSNHGQVKRITLMEAIGDIDLLKSSTQIATGDNLILELMDGSTSALSVGDVSINDNLYEVDTNSVTKGEVPLIVYFKSSYKEDFSSLKNISADYEFINISTATVADTLTTDELIVNGDNLVIITEDDVKHELVASGVTSNTTQTPNPFFTEEFQIVDDVELSDSSSSGSNYMFSGVCNSNSAGHSSTTDWVQLEWLSSTFKCAKIAVYGGASDSPVSIKIIGSTDGTNWDILVEETFSAIAECDHLDFQVVSPQEYVFYRVSSTIDQYHRFTKVDLFKETESYEMDTTSTTAGETPSKVYRVDEKLDFNTTEPDVTGDTYTASIGEDYDLTPGLVAHYLLNNNADDCVGTFDGTPTDVDFKGDSSYFTTASNSHITMALTGVCNGTNQYTISGWFLADENTGPYGTAIISTEGSNSAKMGIAVNVLGSGEIQVQRGNDSSYDSANSSEVYDLDETWHFFVITYNGSTIKCVIDKTDIFSSSSTLSANNGTTQIGRYGANADTQEYYTGTISNVRIYNTVKDQTFIDELYAEGYYPKTLPLPTTSGLIAHYPLTGTAEDSTGNYDGVEGNEVGYSNSDEFGSVSSFDGVNDYITLGTIPIDDDMLLLGDFTMSLWINTDFSSQNDFARLFDRRDSSSRMTLAINFDNGGIKDIFFTDGTGTLDIEEGTQTSNKWIHIVILKSGTSLTMYTDLTSVSTATGGTPSNTEGTVYIGNLVGYETTRGYTGKLSNFRIYNKALTQQEITDIYNYEKNFRAIDIDNGLIAYYPLANNSSDNYFNEYDATDDAGVTYDGTEATLPVGDNITFPSATGFVEAWYWKDDLLLNTVTEASLNSLDDCTLRGVRKYNRTLTEEEVKVIKFGTSETPPSILLSTRTFKDVNINGRSIETKVIMSATGNKCTKISADIWKA